MATTARAKGELRSDRDPSRAVSASLTGGPSSIQTRVRVNHTDPSIHRSPSPRPAPPHKPRAPTMATTARAKGELKSNRIPSRAVSASSPGGASSNSRVNHIDPWTLRSPAPRPPPPYQPRAPAVASTARAKAAPAMATKAPAIAVSGRRLPSGVVLERLVELEVPPMGFQEEWATVECQRKEAYGCGEHGQKILEGLTLHARLVTSPDLTSALYIHASDDALRGIQAEFGVGGPLIQYNDHRMFRANAHVAAADERFVFLTLLFRLWEHGQREYYLVYDAADSSLSMIACLPEECPAEYTTRPLRVPRGDGDGYELLLLAQAVKPEPPPPGRWDLRYDNVICAWTPAATAEDPACRDGTHPWQKRGQWRFPKEINEPFAADVLFSFKGKAFWVDLLQGLVHCDWPPAEGGSVVDFGFIDLPPGCPPDPRWTTPKFDWELLFSMTRDRTMACVAGSIRFVCIDRTKRLGDVSVSVWTLDLAKELWTKDKDFRARDLWRQRSFKRDRLPEMEPRFPRLMADGTLCLVFRNKAMRREDRAEDYICNLDLRSMSVLWSGRLRQYHTDAHPVILPFNFFGKQLCPLVPRKRPLRGIFTQK